MLVIQFLMKHFLRFIQSAGVLAAIGVLLVAGEFSTPIIFYKLFNTAYNGRQLFSLLFLLIPTLVFLFLIPMILNCVLYREKLSYLGLAQPASWKKSLLWMLGALLILVPCIILLGKQTAFQSYYNLEKLNLSKMIVIFIIILPAYYLFEEFFFRGFLLKTLWNKVRWHSIWITDVIFTLAHLAKPVMELLFAIPAGVVLAMLVFRTRSIYPAVIVHYTLGVVMMLTVNPFVR